MQSKEEIKEITTTAATVKIIVLFFVSLSIFIGQLKKRPKMSVLPLGETKSRGFPNSLSRVGFTDSN